MVVMMNCKAVSVRMTKTLKPLCKGKGIRLNVIVVGDDESTQIYVNAKKKKCEDLGIICDVENFDNDVPERLILNRIKYLNKDKSCTGILVQLPLPKRLDTHKILDAVSPDKDVDGLSSYHMAKILQDQEEIVPCTPKGVLMLLREYNITLEGKNVCIVGFGNTVGKPLSVLCLHMGATVTVCHDKTQNLAKFTKHADIIMTATGVPELIKSGMVKKGAIIIDIGITRLPNGKVVGDVSKNTRKKCRFISIVPGGVGMLTIIALIQNLLLLKAIQGD